MATRPATVVGKGRAATAAATAASRQAAMPARSRAASK